MSSPSMVKVPAGEFWMGSSDDEKAYENEKPQHRVCIAAFEIGEYPVTNSEYRDFVRDRGRRPPEHWQENIYLEDPSNHPVTYVSWYDALAYCEWLGERTGRAYRLPTEAEWEKAARGADGRIYPWGDEWDETKANTHEGGPEYTTAVGSYPAGASPYGALDMAGNVWEWCSTLFRGYPYQPADGCEDLGAEGSRVLRGGSYISYRRSVRCACRYWDPPVGRYGIFGFRVAAST